LTFSLNVFAQNITIRGNITDAGGESLIGVAVRVAGTTTGAVTDFDGNYTLNNVPANATLEISYMGMLTQTIAVNSRTAINVVMQEDTGLLDELVVVGYGTMQRRNVTSSISSVRGDDLPQGLGGASIATALQGRVSGLTISGTASPNSANHFQLRGVASINASRGPLIVIDGIPGGDLRSLNQEDIQSIDVLKDASAGAIYGTRAAAGVILITTRQAQEGPVRVTYTGEFATETVRRRPQVLSAAEFVKHGLGTDHGHNTDWYDLLVKDNPFSHRHVVNVQGGSRDARIFATFTAQDLQGIAIGDSRKDYSGRINASFRVLDGFMELRTRTEYRAADRDIRANGMLNDNGLLNTSGQLFNMALKLNPTETAFNPKSESGYNVWTGGFEYFNPLADVNLRQNNGRDTWLLADATMKLNFTPNLSAQSTIGTNRRQWQAYEFVSAFHKESLDARRRGSARHVFARNDDIVFETQVNYANTFGKHDVGAVIGHSFHEANGERFWMRNMDFPVDGLGPWSMQSGTFLAQGSAEMNSRKEVRERLLAGLGRVNYSFDNKYMATASIRREGSSKFGSNNRWGTFWALSGGWRVSAESFMQDLSFVNDLRLRVGYGVTGNNGFTAGRSTPMFAYDTWWLMNGVWDGAYGVRHNVNPDLHWEEKSEWNFGIDYALFNNRVWGKLDIFQRYVDGMIMDIQVPVPPSVHDRTTMNYGNLKGNGWEFEIGGNIVNSRDFQYNSSVRFSSSSTTITSLRGHGTFDDRMSFPAPGAPGTAVRLQEGAKIGQFFLWKYAGIDDQGRWLIYNKNNEVILAERDPNVPGSGKSNEDKRYMGNAMPDLIMAWDHNLTYKNWDMSVFMRSWIGHDVFNTLEMYYGLPTVPGQNVLKEAFGRNAHIKGEKQLTDYFLENGTFLKIDAINIGYNLNLKRFHQALDKARIYLTVRDVATFTKYRGMNPEVRIDGLDPGFERYWDINTIYPQTRRYTLGVQVTF
jgi:TonB-linked SusC/RagA family outer membrane protein